MPTVESDVFDKFDILQNYYEGFTFGWQLRKEAVLTKPVTFVVQYSPTGLDNWEDHSPPVVGLTWSEDCRNRKNKNNNLFFRVKATSQDGKTYYSPAQTALGNQDLRSYIYAKEIMRKEVVQMRGLSGVQVSVYKKMHEGEQCEVCRDPITKKQMDEFCEVCNGTGFTGGWYGPFPAYATFSVRQVHKKHAQDGAFVEDDRTHQIRIIGSPALLRGDMVVDTSNNLRYTVNMINNAVELRRIAVIQELAATEIETSDIKYRVGTE